MATVLAPPIPRPRYEALARRARLLSWLSLARMTVEGAVALAAGSIALVGFGLDSAIEGLASVIVIWRFTGRRVFSHEAERRAQRLVAAVAVKEGIGTWRGESCCAHC
jgi:hypothetical protein